MSYVTRATVEALVGAEALRQVLDADLDGADDDGAFEALANAASARVDALLGMAFAVPFEAPVPPTVIGAATAFFCELVYRRGGKAGAKANPWETTATTWETRLQEIAKGELPLWPRTAIKGGRVAAPSTHFQPGNQEGV